MSYFYKKENNFKGYGYIGLAVLFFLVFLICPIIFSMGLSLFEWQGLTPNPFEKFVGISNYIELTKDPTFLIALKNTFYFVLGSLFFQNLFGFIIAVFLFFGRLRGGMIWRLIIFFPCVLSSVMVGLVWRKIFLFDGLLNNFISLLFPNLTLIQWLGNTVTPIFIVIIVSV